MCCSYLSVVIARLLGDRRGRFGPRRRAEGGGPRHWPPSAGDGEHARLGPEWFPKALALHRGGGGVRWRGEGPGVGVGWGGWGHGGDWGFGGGEAIPPRAWGFRTCDLSRAGACGEGRRKRKRPMQAQAGGGRQRSAEVGESEAGAGRRRQVCVPSAGERDARRVAVRVLTCRGNLLAGEDHPAGKANDSACLGVVCLLPSSKNALQGSSNAERYVSALLERRSSRPAKTLQRRSSRQRAPRRASLPELSKAQGARPPTGLGARRAAQRAGSS